jgi:hypothetical protein
MSYRPSSRSTSTKTGLEAVLDPPAMKLRFQLDRLFAGRQRPDAATLASFVRQLKAAAADKRSQQADTAGLAKP